MKLIRTAIKHPELYPLVACISFAGGFALFCSGRAALKYPDLVWNHKTNPEPWNKIKQTDQVKMYQTHDYTSNRKEFPNIND